MRLRDVPVSRAPVWRQSAHDSGYPSQVVAAGSRCTPPARIRTPAPGVAGLFIWLRIDDQRQRSFVTGYGDRPPGSQEHKDIRGRMHADRRGCVPGGGQTLLVGRVLPRPGPGGLSLHDAPPSHPPVKDEGAPRLSGDLHAGGERESLTAGDVPARAGTSPLLRLAPVGGCPWAGTRLGVCLLECRVLHADGRVLGQPGVPQALPGAGQELVQAARTRGRIDGVGVSA